MRKIVSKSVAANIGEYVGEEGELFFDQTIAEIRISDGATAGGLSVTGADQQLNTTDDVAFRSVTLLPESNGYFGRISTDGNNVWFQGVAGDENGNLYAVGGANTGIEGSAASLIYKFGPNGNEIWKKSVASDDTQKPIFDRCPLRRQ